MKALIICAGVGIGWYVFQVCSRKARWIGYKLKRALVALIGYIVTVALLAAGQGIPTLEAVGLGLLVGLGVAWLVVRPPKDNRRIPAAVRRKVIERDLTSKGLEWNPAKYHIDHHVPYSRGGDHSVRNLRVIEKRKNLRKGAKMPGFRDFLRKEHL